MAWLDDVFGMNGTDISDDTSTLDDRDLALNLLASSKAGVGMLSAAIVETTNPQLRQMLTAQLTAGINGHFQLSDMAIENGWYNAYDEPKEQINIISKETQNIIK
ncbi:spore coat protein [Tissierella sp.]|uniref:spore coat protein n=1 Tax=Tissierella sp. TaxID=41274 RepID=UPI002866ED02|nr:spore coat protein [Tissierella sp.]MDR7856475.1 spore coat protein [Tissierella sp.]